MKWCSIIMMTIYISGCAFSQLDKGLSELEGQEIETAFNVLGYPDTKQEYGLDTVYIWGTEGQGALLLPNNSNTVGTIGTIPFQSQTFSTQVVPINYNCTIKLIANPFDRIKAWEWSGNQAGCSFYAKKLKSYYKTQ